MVSFSNYDLANVKAAEFEVIPPGDYPAIIAEIEEKTTKAGTGKYLNLKLQILDGKYQNRTLFDILNTINPNPIAQNIGRQQLKAVCIAVNKPEPKDSSELLNKPLMITVKVGKDQNGNPRNEIKGYKARLVAAKVEKNMVEQSFESEPVATGEAPVKKNPFA